MDFFDGFDYRLNKFFLSLTGLWPYDSPSRRNAVLTVIVVVTGSNFIGKLGAAAAVYTNTNLLIECMAPIIVDLAGLVKLSTTILKFRQIKTLLDQIKINWSTVKVYEEVAVLRRYTDDGRKLAQMYVCGLYSAMLSFMIMPFVPLLIGTQNESDPRPVMHDVEYYYIDANAHYYLTLVHSIVSITMCITVYVAVDAMYIVFVQHACGMFATIGYRLEHMVNHGSINTDMHPSMKNDVPYKSLGESIQMHIDTLRFAKIMESLYNIGFLFQAGLNMIILSVTGVQAATNVANPHELFRQITFTSSQLLHLGFESYQAQQLMDHSTEVHENLINSPWYLTSARTKKLVSFMVMRSQTACTLTAGKLYVISMESCSAIVRMSVSYFMMLRTFE